jgi:modification methylase
MAELKDESVHLIITSPPYWQLKDYGIDSQIGFNDSYENYINNLNLVWKESYRVLHPSCRLCVNIGDQFARSVYYGRYKIIPIRTEIIKFCEEIGFDYMGAIIWQKVTTTNTTGGATIMGSFPYPRNGIIKLDYEFILIFKKIGTPPKVTPNIKLQSKLTKQEWNEYFQGHWNFGGAKQDKHLAMFPEELPKRLIKMFSFVGDTVLDPFLGSGTTSLAAKNLNRNSIGYEINHEFIPIIMDKISHSHSPLFSEFDIELYEQSKISQSFDTAILQLPYIYKDPHKLNKKIDIHKLQYGSKVDKNGSKRLEYYSVKEVISPELIKLNNDIVIRLIGIKPNKSTFDEAKEFIYNYTKGKKVFIRHDAPIYDENSNLLCYLYLQNKTFINAHLLKRGLAEIDDSYDFRYRIKFLKLKDVCGGNSK